MNDDEGSSRTAVNCSVMLSWFQTLFRSYAEQRELYAQRVVDVEVRTVNRAVYRSVAAYYPKFEFLCFFFLLFFVR